MALASERRVGLSPDSRIDLSETDVRGHPEPLVDGSPFGEEASVLADVGQQRIAAGGIVQHGPDSVLEKARDFVAAVAQSARERLAVENPNERGFGPDAVARPVALGGKGDKESAVDGAAVGDRVIGSTNTCCQNAKPGRNVSIAARSSCRRTATISAALRPLRSGSGDSTMCPTAGPETTLQTPAAAHRAVSAPANLALLCMECEAQLCNGRACAVT